MNEYCDQLVKDTNVLLADPKKHSLDYFARQIFEQGYVEGKAMERKLLRLKLGLAVPSDMED